jgi:hypothetical protein
VVALPALLGGSWISPSCESHPGGVWLRRQLRVYAGDKLWTGRWDYFGDPRCSSFLYGITAAGSYVQRARRHRRHDAGALGEAGSFFEDEIFGRAKRRAEEVEHTAKSRAKGKGKRKLKTEARAKKLGSVGRSKPSLPKGSLSKVGEAELPETTGPRRRRSLDEVDYYRQLLQSAQPSMAESFAAMLRGNQRREETTRKPLMSATPSGTSELDLHVAESLLIAGDLALAKRCGAALAEGSAPKTPRLSNWPSSCVPHSLDAPSTLGLRARISVDWYGQYTLLLGARDKSMWDAPLLQCGPTSMKNPVLRSHLRRSVGLRFGILFNGSITSAPALGFGAMMLAATCLATFCSRSA